MLFIGFLKENMAVNTTLSKQTYFFSSTKYMQFIRFISNRRTLSIFFVFFFGFVSSVVGIDSRRLMSNSLCSYNMAITS